MACAGTKQNNSVTCWKAGHKQLPRQIQECCRSESLGILMICSGSLCLLLSTTCTQPLRNEVDSPWLFVMIHTAAHVPSPMLCGPGTTRPKANLAKNLWRSFNLGDLTLTGRKHDTDIIASHLLDQKPMKLMPIGLDRLVSKLELDHVPDSRILLYSCGRRFLFVVLQVILKPYEAITMM